MAINFLNDLDFNQNEAFHLVLENQANDTAAGTPVDGQLYYDTGNNVVKYGEGGSWVPDLPIVSSLSGSLLFWPVHLFVVWERLYQKELID